MRLGDRAGILQRKRLADGFFKEKEIILEVPPSIFKQEEPPECPNLYRGAEHHWQKINYRKLVSKSVILPFSLLKSSQKAIREGGRWRMRPTIGEYVPSSHEVVKHMLDFAELKPKQKHIDIGCGDGRVVLEACKLGADSFGCDVNQTLLRKAWVNAIAAGLDGKVNFKYQRAEEVDFSQTDLVTIYTNHFDGGRILRRLLSVLPKGARVVSHQDRINYAFVADKTKAVQKNNCNVSYIQMWEI